MFAYGVNTKKNVSITLKYNLQFFADGDDDVNNTDNTDDASGDNSGDNNDGQIDTAAFAEIISDKDKKIDELQGEVAKLKKTQAEMLLQINAGSNEKKDIGQSIIDLLDTRKIR